MSVIKVPVVVVTTNAARDLPGWLASVRALASATVQPIPCIADNGSSDETVGMILGEIRSGGLDPANVFWLRRNEWFNSAQNYAFRHLGTRGYEYVATLNQDAQADPDWLSALVVAAQNGATARAGMWGGPILSPGRMRISSAGHTLRGRDGAFLDVDRDVDVAKPRHSGTPGFEPFSPCFAAGLWSLEMIGKAGLPDNDQLIYYDDVELGYKARLNNWSAVYVAGATAIHPLPRSTTEQTRRTAQERGRLALAARYFPDRERQRILSMAQAAGALDAHLRLFTVPPDAADGDRTRVWNEWADRYAK